MIDLNYINLGQVLLKIVGILDGLEPGQKLSPICGPVDQRMNSITERAYGSDEHLTLVALDHLRFPDGLCAVLDRVRPHAAHLVHLERDVLDAVTMLGQVGVQVRAECALLFAGSCVPRAVGRAERRCEHEPRCPIADNVGRRCERTGLRSAVCQHREPVVVDEVGHRLPGITNVPADVIEPDVIGVHGADDRTVGGNYRIAHCGYFFKGKKKKKRSKK